MIMLPMTLGNP